MNKVALVFAFAAALLLAKPLSADLSLFTGPPSSVFTPGGQLVTVPVNIQNASDVFAYQFFLGFDPTIIQLQSIVEGSFLQTAGTTDFFGAIDNVGGVATVADTLQGFTPGAGGAGVLADLTFLATNVGTSPLDFSDVIAIDSNFDEIPVDTVDGSVDIVVTPEPAFWLLLAVGLGTLVTVKRRQRPDRS